MVEAYVTFLNSANARLGPRRQAHDSDKILRLPIAIEGLENLINSFSSGSPHDRVKDLEEWNPFSQRPIFEVDPKISPSLSYDFDYVSDIAHRFIVLVHEAMHVLLWEPFFCGRFKPNRTNFRDLSLAFEGFCFWYAEIVVNGKLNFKFPDGEGVLERNSVSQSLAHPQSAFRGLKLTDPRQIMQIYTQAFRGYETKLSQPTTDPIVLNLAERFYSFCITTVRGPHGMFEAFKEFGLFDEFYSRFCKVRELPSLLPESLLGFPMNLDTDTYCWKMYAEGMKHVAGLNHKQIVQVRLRRAIQTRAYFAYCLKHTIDSRNFSAHAKFPASKTLKGINTYINILESSIASLRLDHRQSKRQLWTADQAFEHDVRKPLQKYKVLTTVRSQLVPELPGHSKLKVNEDRSSLSPAKLTKFAQGVLQTYVKPKLEFNRNSRASVGLAKTTLRILKLTHKIEGSRNHEHKAKWARSLSTEIDAVLKHELVFTQWSLPLAAINPARNSFREILFIYK